MPQWIEDRAKHIRKKNPEMPESQSWAIATQQAHAAGKSPEGYGTPEGRREAKAKYDEGKAHYKKMADPKTKTSGIEPVFFRGFTDELEKISTATGLPSMVKKVSTPELPKKPKHYSQPREPNPPAPTTDLLSGTRTIQPPPVTAG